MKTVAIGVVVLVGLFAGVAEGAFIRGVELPGSSFPDVERPPTYRLELVMEEDARVLQVSIILLGPIPTADLSINPFSFSVAETLIDSPPTLSVGGLNAADNLFEVPNGEIIPLAILDYGRRILTIESGGGYVIRGILSGDTEVTDIQTQIDNIFPGRQLPEPGLVQLIAMGIVGLHLRGRTRFSA